MPDIWSDVYVQWSQCCVRRMVYRLRLASQCCACGRIARRFYTHPTAFKSSNVVWVVTNRYPAMTWVPWQCWMVSSDCPSIYALHNTISKAVESVRVEPHQRIGAERYYRRGRLSAKRSPPYSQLQEIVCAIKDGNAC